MIHPIKMHHDFFHIIDYNDLKFFKRFGFEVIGYYDDIQYDYKIYSTGYNVDDVYKHPSNFFEINKRSINIRMLKLYKIINGKIK